MAKGKKKREQTYDDLWDWEAEDFARVLNRFGVHGVADLMGCSRTTVWRATRAKGLTRGKDGKYTVSPPDPKDPAQVDDFIKMVDARPRRGPSIVNVGNGQEIFGGRWGRQKGLELDCPHEFEQLEIEDRLGLNPPQVIVRCRYCLGIKY